MMIKTREGTILALAGLVVIGLLYGFLVVSPALSRQRTLQGYISRKQADLDSMLEMKGQWETFQRARADAEAILRRRGGGFTLLTYLERVSREAGIEKKIRYMKPLSFQEKDESYQVEGIEMELESLDIRRLVDFLYRIEYSKNLLVVERIKIRPVSRGTERLLDLTLQVKTYRPREGQGEEQSRTQGEPRRTPKFGEEITLSPPAAPFPGP